MTKIPESFEDAADVALGAGLLDKGYVILPVENRACLDAIRDHIAASAARFLGLESPADSGAFLDGIHRHVAPSRLNDMRLAVFDSMTRVPWLRPAYFALARRALESLVGNELAMQRRINLSIQMPDDPESVLPLHSDVWSGDSPFEIVLWVPYVDCRRTKSMFILDRAKDEEVQRRLASFSGRSVEQLYREVEPNLEFLEIPYGNCLLFTQNVMHGNRMNVEPETRWSSNCRFKSLMSPYADKRLGEFFEPIVVRPATRLGMSYKLPGGFRG